MAYAGYAPGHRVVERTPLERALRAIARPETLDLLERLSKNVARAPGEEKYRKLKRANATIGREIFDDEHAMRAMLTMGWVVGDDRGRGVPDAAERDDDDDARGARDGRGADGAATKAGGGDAGEDTSEGDGE